MKKDSQPRSSSNRNIAFIGGGSVGPVALIYLAKFAEEKKVDLSGYFFHLIDPKGFGNGGIAYGECDSKHILNTLKNEMTPWERTKFHNYLRSIGRSEDPLHFHLRTDYRNFLAIELSEARQKLEGLGISFVEHRALALIKKNKEGFSIVDEHSLSFDDRLKNLPAENILLTVGYGPNKNFSKLWNKVGYVHSLYPIQHLKETLSIKTKPVNVAILGSASALYDFAIACPVPADDVKVTIFSTNPDEGLEIREVEREHLLKDVPLLKLKSLPNETKLKVLENTINDAFTEARKNEVGPDTWIAFRMMLVIGSVLSRLDAEVAKTFRHSSLFKKVKRLGGSTTQPGKNALSILKPNFVSANFSESDIEVLPDGRFKISVNNKEYFFDCIVNATGHGRHNSAILEDMKAQNLATINPNLDILATDKTGYRLLGSGVACIGPATHFGVDGIESFSRPIEHFSRELLEQIGKA